MDPMISILPITISTGSLESMSPIGVRVSSCHTAPCSSRKDMAVSIASILGASINGNL